VRVAWGCVAGAEMTDLYRGALLYVGLLTLLASGMGAVHTASTRHRVYRASALRATVVLWVMAVVMLAGWWTLP